MVPPTPEPGAQVRILPGGTGQGYKFERSDNLEPRWRQACDLRQRGRVPALSPEPPPKAGPQREKGLLPGGRFARSMDPQLVDEHWQVGVELIITDTRGKHDRGLWVVDRHPWCLAHDLLVDARPEPPGRTGIVGLERERLGDLGVDPVVAELGCIDVARVAREERLAGQQRADEV